MDERSVGLLVDFHYWARDRMLTALAPLSAEEYARDRGSSFRSLRETAVHVYAAERLWRARWEGASPTTMAPATSYPDVPTLRAAWIETERGVRALVAGLDRGGLERRLDYTSLDGRPLQSVFWHMLQHLVNHGAYHRGQITTMLRQSGAAPPASVDLITFYRENGL